MNATKPLCAKVVTPISAIKSIIIGNIWNFLLWINSAKISLIIENFLMDSLLW